jgi:hypothetical protein
MEGLSLKFLMMSVGRRASLHPTDGVFRSCGTLGNLGCFAEMDVVDVAPGFLFLFDLEHHDNESSSHFQRSPGMPLAQCNSCAPDRYCRD